MNNIITVFRFCFDPRGAYRSMSEQKRVTLSGIVLCVLGVASVSIRILRIDGVKAFEPWWQAALIIIPIAPVLMFIATIIYANLINWAGNMFSRVDAGNLIRIALPFSFFPGLVGNAISLTVHNASAHVAIDIVSAVWTSGIAAVLVSEVKPMSVVEAIITVVVGTMIPLIPVGLIYGIFYYLVR